MPLFRKRHKGSGFVAAESLVAQVLLGLGVSSEECRIRAQLRQLWRHWEMVLGTELSPLAVPLGRHHGVLHIGVEDAMLVQELQYARGEILERVNAFMGGPVFHKVAVELRMGREGLHRITAPDFVAPVEGDWRVSPQSVQETTVLTGRFLTSMEPHSPVARAYAHFLRRSKNWHADEDGNQGKRMAGYPF